MIEPAVRVDPLTGRRVVITAARQQRPNLPATDCPFCPGGLEAPENYEVRWFANRWPSMPGRCEVLLYSPAHDATFWSLGVDGAERVVRLWLDRTAKLGAQDDVQYVMPFENRGPEVGATIAHPHGQLYAFDHVPNAALAELDRNGPCPLCAEEPGARVVSERGTWRAVVPEAAAWPFELLLAPTGHEADLTETSTHDCAGVLVDVLARLDRLFDAPMPYMLWVHQRPTDGASWPRSHVHVHIAAHYRAPGTARYVAAGELGSGEYFNPVLPETAAAKLRES